MPRHIQLEGIIMRPCSMTLKDNEKVMRNDNYFTPSKFRQKYIDTIAAGQIVAESAKIYIQKNWKKVKDWKDLEVIISDKDGKITEYYNFQESKGWVGDFGKKIMKSLDDKNKKRHNPATEVSDVVLDPTDGDFSITINKKEYWWIDDESVIMIADYIEKKLKK